MYLRVTIVNVYDRDSPQGIARKTGTVFCAGAIYVNLCVFVLRISETFMGYFDKGAVARLAGFADFSHAVCRLIARKVVVFKRIEIVAHQSEPTLSNLVRRALNP